MRTVTKPIRDSRTGFTQDKRVLDRLLKHGLLKSVVHRREPSEYLYLQLLDIAEDLLAGLGLAEDFHLSIWAEHRRRRAELVNNGKYRHEQKRKTKWKKARPGPGQRLTRCESY